MNSYGEAESGTSGMAQIPDILVVDASVVVKWFIEGEVLGEQATALWSRHIRQEAMLLAPSHIHCEVPSAIIAATRGRVARLTREQGRDAIEEFLSVRLRTAPTKELVLPAFELSQGYDVSIYDALYVALAADYRIPLITADAKLVQKLADLQYVRWLGDL